MHVMIFLLAIAALIMGAQYIGETYSPYRYHLLAVTLLYFSAWKIARVIAPKVRGKQFTWLSQSAAKCVELSASASFLVALAFYVAAIVTLFGVTLFFADRSFSAIMVVALGFGVALGLLHISESRNQLTYPQPASNHYSLPIYQPPLCPFCGKELRTSRAKQCFHCHKDWHDV
jgi:hypothetical protein